MIAVTAESLLADPIGHYPAATVAAFDPTCGDLPRRKLDLGLAKAYLERLSVAGAPAVLIAASTGQGHLRTVAELAEWFTAAAEAKLPGTTKMALLRPEDGLPANLRLLEQLKAQGYAVIFFRPGTNLRPTASVAEVAESLQPLVAAAARLELAVGLYSISDVSGLPLLPEAVSQLLQGPGGDHLVAVKVTEANYEQSTLRYLTAPELQRLKIVQGWDPHLARALQNGPQYDAAGRQRCGVTSGPMSLAVYQYLHIFAAASRGDWAEVAAAQAAVTILFQSMQDDPQKFADLQRAKFIMGLGQPLCGTVQESQIARVFAALDSLARPEDRQRLARSLDLMEHGPFHDQLTSLY